MATIAESVAGHNLLAPLEPFDEHNRRLRDNVAPPDWRNPAPNGRYHLVVLGAGTGGLVTAAIGAALGARVALVERALLGGDCLNVGCVPSKAVLRAARAWAAARQAASEFGGPQAQGAGDFSAVMERMRRLRAQISPNDSAARFRGLGVDVYLGDARFTGRDTVEVRRDGSLTTLRFHRAVIATGGRAAVPPIPGLRDAGYRTNETIFSLTERPDRLAVLGGGPIGVELAQAFSRLGVRVTLLNLDERLLLRDDREAAGLVQAALERDGVEVLNGAKTTSVTRAGAIRTLRFTHRGIERAIDAEEILVATGRVANVEDLNLEAAGVKFTEKGVTVDRRLRSTNRRIFAVGDVAGRWQFTHAADAEARLVVANAFFFGIGGGDADKLVIPWATYTSPEVAHVGITEAEANARGPEVTAVRVPFEEVDRAILDGATQGYLRIWIRAGSDEILGATVVGERAADVLAEVTLAMKQRIGLGKLSSTVHPYPTVGEVVRKAADVWRRGKLTPTAKAVFRGFFSLLRS